MQAPMIDAVIFDMDGLLIDSEPFWREAERAVFRDVGIELTDAMCEEAMGLRVNEVLHHWHKTYPWPSPDFDGMEKNIVELVGRLIREKGELMPGAKEAVTFFHQRHVPIALASASALSLIRNFLNKFGFASYFDVVHSAEHETFGKPHPAVFLTTAEKLGVPPTRCLVFEDSFNGLIAAKAARMTCIVVPEPGVQNQPRWAIADRQLSTLEHFSESTWKTLNPGR